MVVLLFCYGLGLFLLFSCFFSENSTTPTFLPENINNFSYQEKPGLKESAPFTLQFLGG